MAYAASKKTDYLPQGLRRFLKQFRNKKNLSALVGSYLNQIQKLEDAIWEVIEYRLLINAEGVQLDALGKIVGRGRNDLNDTDYRIAIRTQIRINRSCGTPDDLIDVTALSTPDGTDFDYTEYYPATVCITLFTPISNITLLYNNLRHTKAGGVKLFLIYSDELPEDTFTFAPGDVPADDVARGFGDTTFTDGGVFANVLI